MTIEINEMAHITLTVSRFEGARAFYNKLLPLFGMELVFDGAASNTACTRGHRSA